MPTVTRRDALVTGSDALKDDVTATEAASRTLIHLKLGNLALERLRASLERDEARLQSVR